MQFQFRDGDGLAIYEHLESLHARNRGRLTPEVVVKDATKASSPLHKYFEWDDTKAAEKHRLEQARGLIRTVVVRFNEDFDSEPVRAFVSVKVGGDEQPSYQPTHVALTRPDLRGQLLNQAMDDMIKFRRKYNQLKELAKVLETMDETLGSLV